MCLRASYVNFAKDAAAAAKATRVASEAVAAWRELGDQGELAKALHTLACGLQKTLRHESVCYMFPLPYYVSEMFEVCAFPYVLPGD